MLSSEIRAASSVVGATRSTGSSASWNWCASRDARTAGTIQRRFQMQALEFSVRRALPFCTLNTFFTNPPLCITEG